MGAGSGKVFMRPAAAINNDGLAIKACTNSSGHAMAREPHSLPLTQNEDVSAHAASSNAARPTPERAAERRLE